MISYILVVKQHRTQIVIHALLKCQQENLYHELFVFSSRTRHTRFSRDWSSDVCSSDLFGSLAWSAFSLTISVDCARVASSGPKGRFRWKRTWYGPTASTASTGVKKTRMGSLFFESRRRVKVKTTSFDVIGSSLWKTVLSTRSKSQLFSFSCFHDFARPGMNWPASSTYTSLL